jgi:hypothetical protein
MTGFSLLTNFVGNPEKLVRRVRPHVIPPQDVLSAGELVIEAPFAPEPMAEKTLRDFPVPSVANVATRPNIAIGDVKFKLKSSLINMLQASLFYGKPNKDANTHLQSFLELCETVVIQGVTTDAFDSVCFPSPSWGRQNSDFTRTTKPSTCGTNVPWCSSQNSSRWAKPTLYAGRFPAFSSRDWNQS